MEFPSPLKEHWRKAKNTCFQGLFDTASLWTMLGDYRPNLPVLTTSSISTEGTTETKYLVASAEVKYLYPFRGHFLDGKNVYQKAKEQYDTNSVRVECCRLSGPACGR